MSQDTAELKVTVESTAAWARLLHITVPAQRVERERRNAVAQIAKQVRLPGFRKGKIPAHVVEKRFGPAIEQQALERVMGSAYREAIKQEGLQPITDGSIDNVSYESGTDLSFDVGFDIRPVVELARVGGFVVRRPPVEITQSQIDQVIERLRDEQAVWKSLEPGTAPVKGDRVTVEITPLDGESAPKVRNYDLVLGEGQAAPAVESVIETMQPGQENNFAVELPERSEDPASPTKTHQIHVRMTDAKRAERPVLDDAFARSLGDFDNLTVLQDRIRTDLEREADREGERAVRNQLISNVIDANPFEVPASMVEAYLKQLVPDREGADAARVKEVRDIARGGAEFGIKRLLIIERIADLESLAASQAEVDERVQALAERLGRPAAEIHAQLRKNGRIAEIEQEITEEKVFAYLKSLSSVD
jgi:trigger factor